MVNGCLIHKEKVLVQHLLFWKKKNWEHLGLEIRVVPFFLPIVWQKQFEHSAFTVY